MAKKTASSDFNKQAAKERVLKIFPILCKAYPDAKVALNYSTPLELLIATILAAQCTDARVNIVTKDLFRKYRRPEDWISVPQEELENDIRSTGFYRNKARAIQKTCKALIERFGGQVPQTMEELLTLDGVGRKTANVILGNCFGVPSIICDTHMIRLARRLELSPHTDPVKLEFDLMEVVPKNRYGGWTTFSHCIVAHGRQVCIARKPRCSQCVIAPYCPAANKPEKW